MKKNVFVLVLLVNIALFWGALRAEADTASFSVKSEFPENQIDSSKGYFSLKMLPGSSQRLTIKLSNMSDQEMTIEAKVGPATTNNNGVVDYLSNNAELDSTLQYNLVDLVDYAKEITIEANSTIDYYVDVQMPEATFKGTIAGGITFKEKKEGDSTDATTTQNGITLKNEIQYMTAILLQQSTEPIEPKVVLKSVKANQVNARNVIEANLQNSTATYINEIESTVKVYKKGKSEVVFTQKTENQQMAPNSNFNYTLHLANNTAFEAGEYSWVQIVKSGEYEWTMTKDFTITKKEASSFNKTDLTIEKSVLSSMQIVLIACCLLLSITIVYLSIKNHRLKNKK